MTAIKTMKDFDPNKLGLTNPNYATFIPTRNPQFKIHKGRGPALNAISSINNDVAIDAILYTLDLSSWIEIYRVENYNRPDECENCNKSLMVSFDPKQINGKKFNVGNRMWHDRNTDRPKLCTVCRDCAKLIK